MSVLKKGAYYLIISFLPLIANFLVLPFFTVYLSKEEYGVLAMAGVIQAYITILIELGLSGSFSRFYYDYYKKLVLVNSLLSTIFILIIVSAIIVGISLAFFGDHIFDLLLDNNNVLSFKKYGLIIWALTFTTILYNFIQSYYRNEEDIKMFSIIALSGFFLMLLGNIMGVIYFRQGAFGSLFGKLIGILIILIPFFIFFYTKNQFKVRLSLIKPLFKFSIPLIPYLLLGILMNSVDKQYIERYLGMENLGLYNIALMIGSMPSIFLTAAQSTIYPQIFRLLKEGKENIDQIKELISMLLLFILLIVASLISFINIITKMFIGREYHDIIYLVPIIALAYCFRAVYVVLILPIEYEKKSLLMPITTGFGVLIALISGPFLIGNYHLVGACLMVVLVQVSQVAISILFVKRIGWLNSGLYHQPIFYIGSIILIVFTMVTSRINISSIFLNVIPITFILGLIVLKYGNSFIKMIKKA